MRRSRVQGLLATFAGAVLAIGGVGAVLTAAPASSALTVVYTVTSTADAGGTCTGGTPSGCTLRQAIIDGTAADIDVDITVDPSLTGQTIGLSTGELFFNPAGAAAALTIHGNGVIVHQGTANARVFHDSSSGLLTIDGMTITGGNTTAAPANGAAVLAKNSLTITNTEITGNTATASVNNETAGSIVFQGQSSDDTLTLSGVNLHDNTVTSTGVGWVAGIIWSYTTAITSSTIANNTAQALGSGPSLGIFDSSDTTISGSSITGNRVLSDTGPADGIFDIGDMIITNTTISGNTNSSSGGGDAEGIFDSGDVTLTNSTVSGNTNRATEGGDAAGIFDSGNVTLTNSTVNGNTNSTDAGGPALGIFDTGSVTLTDSAVTNNTNSANSGPAYGIIDAGPTTITRSTISGNTNSAGSGTAFGGIDTRNLTVTNSTISNNVASGEASLGGAIYQGSTSIGSTAQDVNDNPRHPEAASRHAGVRGAAVVVPTLTLVYSTIVDNTAETGANINTDATASSFGTVVALPHSGVNCVFTGLALVSNGWNFSDDTTCGFTNAASGDHQGTGLNPQLGALADNGGSGPTRLPAETSPLIDAIPLASCQADGAAGITTDERGITRPQRSGCDIGAVEVVAPPVIIIAPKFAG